MNLTIFLLWYFFVVVQPFNIPKTEDLHEIVSDSGELSPHEIEKIKRKILDGLGLEKIPESNLTANISKEEFDVAYKEYLALVEEEDAKYEDDLDDFSSFRFYSNKISHQIKGRGRRSARPWQKIIHFHVFIPTSSDANSSSVVKATGKFWKRGSNLVEDHDRKIPVSFYRIDNIPRGRVKYSKLDPILIETKNISIFDNEWIELDMKNSVEKWLSNPDFDTGVLVSCPDCYSVGVKFVAGGGGRDKSKIPRLDVQTEIVGLRRVKRSRKMKNSLRKRGRHADCHDNRKRSSRCCRRSMQVKFSDLPQFDFIISPRQFDAYYCSGRCPARYNPANEHALLQAFLNLRGKRNIPGPCCAPTQLKGLPILHIGNDGRLKTNFWSDVIVTKCECA